MQIDIIIRQMKEDDIDRIMQTFAKWDKERTQYEKYFKEQQRGKRVVLVALHGKKVAGYTTIDWNSSYEPFRQGGIPEITDLNVINEYQKQGIGTALVHAAERIAFEHSKSVIGISVEQSPSYGAANRLYPKLGYIPDGKGITQHDNELHLIKNLPKG